MAKPETTRKLPTIYIKHRGIFSSSLMLQGIQKWLAANEYEFHAPKYKIKPDEAEYEIYGQRNISEYVKFKIDVHIWVRGVSDVEVVKDGKKEKMSEGYLQVELDGTIELDYSKRFGGNKFLQGLQDWYHKYVIKQTIEDVWEDDMFFKLNQLAGVIKHAFELEVR